MNPTRRSPTVILSALICVASISNSVGAEVVTVVGSVSLDLDGHPQIVECSQHRPIPLGAMTSTAYSHFAQAYADLSKGGQFPVLAEVSGELAKNPSTTDHLIFDSPVVQLYRLGACNSTPLTTDKPRVLADALARLKQKLDALRATPNSNSSFYDDLNMTALIGATRTSILTGLGEPEFCASPNDCPNSEEWSYFFFYSEPFTFGGGCCALQLKFDAASKVSFVTWIGQR